MKYIQNQSEAELLYSIGKQNRPGFLIGSKKRDVSARGGITACSHCSYHTTYFLLYDVCESHFGASAVHDMPSLLGQITYVVILH